MGTRFIDKETGATTTTAIADDTTGRRKVRNLQDNAGMVYDKVAHVLKYNGNDAIKTLVASDVPVNLSAETVTGTRTLTAADNGKTIFLNAATEFAVTLPSPAAGLFFRFIVANAPETASYTVVTAGAAQILAGQVYGSDGGDGDSETDVTATTITFVDGASVVGDSADVWSDGTSWFARCFCNVATTGITITG